MEVAQLREEIAALQRRAAAAEAAAVAAAQPSGKALNGTGPAAAAPAVVERRVVVEVPVERVVEREVYVAVTPRRGEHIVEASPVPAVQPPVPALKISPNRGMC